MIIPPPSFSFKGDKNKAMSLKSQALQLYDFTVRAARLGGLNSISRTFTLSDGSTISFRSAKQSNYNNIVGKVIITSPIVLVESGINTSEIYMESGLVIYTATGCGALNNSYRPWKFRVLDTSGPQGTFNPSSFSFSGVLQGLESIAFGCRVEEQVEEVSAVPCGENVEPITITDGGYCTTAILPKKNNYLKVRPSVFSGLTRRYVQALYGANRYDLEVDPDFFSIPHVKVPRYVSEETRKKWAQEEAFATSQGQVYKQPSDKTVIYADFPECQFISRTTTYDYFFISIRSSQFLDIYPMIFGSSGKVILDKLRSGDFTQDPKHLESYALSDAVPDTDSLLESLDLGNSIVEGDPLAFTWNANSTGTRLTLVTHSQLAEEKMYSCREYSMTIQITRSDTPSTFSWDSQHFTAGALVSKVAPDSKWNPRLDTVWGHSYTYNKQIWFSGSWFSPGTTQSDPVCPMYSYYDYNDIKRVVNIETMLATIPYSSGTVLGPPGCGPGVETNERDQFTQNGGLSGTKRIMDLNGVINPSRSYSKYTLSAGDPYVSLIMVGPVEGSVQTSGCFGAAGFAWQLYHVPGAVRCDLSNVHTLSTGVPSNFCTPISTSSDGWGTYNAGVNWDSIATSTLSSTLNEVKSAKVLVVIPFGDCCSVLYGLHSGVSFSSKTETTIGGWAATQVGYVQVRAKLAGTWQVEIIGEPVPTVLGGWASTIMGYNFDMGYKKDFTNTLGLNTTTNYPDDSTLSKYTLVSEVQGQAFQVKAGTDYPIWLDSLINPSPLDLFHLLQPTAHCTSDQHSNYSITITTDQTNTFKKGFNDEEIGAIGWQ